VFLKQFVGNTIMDLLPQRSSTTCWGNCIGSKPRQGMLHSLPKRSRQTKTRRPCERATTRPDGSSNRGNGSSCKSKKGNGWRRT
jgi:hypothetical protein